MRRWDDALGRLLVALAVLAERAAAGRQAGHRWRQLRDDAARAAHSRGVGVDTLAARLGLSRSTVGKALRKPRNGQDGAEVAS